MGMARELDMHPFHSAGINCRQKEPIERLSHRHGNRRPEDLSCCHAIVHAVLDSPIEGDGSQQVKILKPAAVCGRKEIERLHEGKLAGGSTGMKEA